MKEQHIHQEVLVSTRTTLAKKVLFKANDSNKKDTPVEKFEEACWNGLLDEMFSQLIPNDFSHVAKIFTWGIYAGKSSLLVDRADAPGSIEPDLSVDPHLFLLEVNLN